MSFLSSASSAYDVTDYTVLTGTLAALMLVCGATIVT